MATSSVSRQVGAAADTVLWGRGLSVQKGEHLGSGYQILRTVRPPCAAGRGAGLKQPVDGRAGEVIGGHVAEPGGRRTHG